MAALTEKQRAFVEALLDQPGMPAYRASEAAGYQNSPGGHRVQAHRLMHDERILAAVHEQAGRRLRSRSLTAANVVAELLDSPDEKIRLKAAGMLLDRVGFGAQQNININQTVTDQSGKAIMERIRALADKHGLDARLLLGPSNGTEKINMPVVEGEFSEATDD